MRHTFLTTYLKWGHKKNRQLLTVSLGLAMSASIGLQGYQLFRNLSQPEEFPEAPATVAPQQASLKQEDFKLLFGYNERPEAKADKADIPKTKLNLILRGSLAGIDGKKYASAIIQDKLYEVGDSLPGGVTLSDVFSDHVVLNRGGQLETLYFPDTGKDSKAFQEYKAPEATKTESGSRPSYTDSPDGKSLEERMQELRDKLQQANQGN